jgi:hypothetical protein
MPEKEKAFSRKGLQLRNGLRQRRKLFSRLALLADAKATFFLRDAIFRK